MARNLITCSAALRFLLARRDFPISLIHCQLHPRCQPFLFARKLLQRILPKAATRFNFSLHLHIIHHQDFYILYITYIIYINCIYITYITGNIYTLSSTPHTSPTTSRSLTSPTASTSHLPQNSNKVTQTYVIYTFQRWPASTYLLQDFYVVSYTRVLT